MLYKSIFSDINGVNYGVEILTDNVSTPVDIVLGGNPVVISSSSEGLFSPIKSRSCVIELVSHDYHFDLYSPLSRGVSVKIYKLDNQKVIFRGYATPCSYNQDYSYLNNIEIECVDAISTGKDFKFDNGLVFSSFEEIILSILDDCGYKGSLYVPESYTKVNGSDISNILSTIHISCSNFIDNDSAASKWTEYEVITEIMKFLGWSLVPYGDDVYLVDYRYIFNGGKNYIVYDIQSGDTTTYTDTNNILNISNLEAGGRPNISIDDIFNKIDISANLYEINKITPDIFSDDAHISITDEKNLGLDKSKWTKTERKGFLWWKSEKKEITGYDYQTICRLDEKSGWEHFYYKKSDLSPLNNDDGLGYYDPTSESNYNKGKINKYCNTVGALIQHYAYRPEEGPNIIPTSLDWENILTFFILDDTTFKLNFTNIVNLEKKVLTYNVDEEVNYKPASGKSWITISGDLFYQYNGEKYGDKNKDQLNIINTKPGQEFYTTAPVDKSIEISDKKYCSLGRKSDDPDHGKGFSMWKMAVGIGDKYWDGEKWVNGYTTFYIKYNNDPTKDEEEFIPAFEWMKCVNTSTYKDKVGVDGYCIPIDSEKDSDPSFGKLKIDIYVPALVPTELIDTFRRLHPESSEAIPWTYVPPVVYVKNFEIGYVYTDTNEWWKQHVGDTGKKDKVYVGYIDENFINEFDTMTFKINTALKDRPISRSYITDGNKYVDTIKHVNAHGGEEKIQEYNVIDEYLDHYSERRPVYECNIHGYYNPLQMFEYQYITDENNENYIFMNDAQRYNMRLDKNTINLISF